MHSNQLKKIAGLGPTVSEVGDISHAKKFEKTCFTMILPEVKKVLEEDKTKSVILCGIETQACIMVCCTLISLSNCFRLALV